MDYLLGSAGTVGSEAAVRRVVSSPGSRQVRVFGLGVPS